MATIAVKKTNGKWDICLNSMKPYLQRTDMIGYICSRNTRILMNGLTEYHETLYNLIKKYGHDILDENGKPTGEFGFHVDRDKEDMEKFAKEVDPFRNLEQTFDIMTLTYDETKGLLTGQQILDLDFMLID